MVTFLASCSHRASSFLLGAAAAKQDDATARMTRILFIKIGAPKAKVRPLGRIGCIDKPTWRISSSKSWLEILSYQSMSATQERRSALRDSPTLACAAKPA